MINKTQRLAWPLIAGLALAALTAGCSHQAAGGDSLAQQKANVMGSPAPPEVQKQVAAQMAAQQAAMQANQQAAQQAAAHGQPPR